MNQGQHVVNENTRNEDLQSIACYECPTLIHVLVPLFLFFFQGQCVNDNNVLSLLAGRVF